jgi:predicted metal-binding membrane protein
VLRIGWIGGRLGERLPASPVLLASIGFLAAAGWISLWAWERSPGARFLHHASAGGSQPVAETSLFVAGWLVMTVAMMLPTTVPLLATFSGMVSRRRGHLRLVGIVVTGYLATWTAFGSGLYLADRLVHLVVEATPWLAAHPELISATVLATAGAYQFSPAKYRCLDECRSPVTFAISRWRGVRPVREAFALGVAHGRFCIGCCWPLMVVMFSVGLGSLAWMFGLGIVMAVEKNVRGGRRLGRPLGAGLLFAALATVAW